MLRMLGMLTNGRRSMPRTPAYPHDCVDRHSLPDAHQSMPCGRTRLGEGRGEGHTTQGEGPASVSGSKERCAAQHL